jgi:hypothetical protein
MSYVVSTNHGSVTAAKSQTFVTPKALNFGADYELVSQSKDECRLVSNKSPLGSEDKFRFAISEIANIYTNSGIDKAFQSQLKTGTKILVGASSVLTFTDSTSGDVYEKPIYGSITLTVPKDPAMTSTVVADFISQIMAGLADWAASAATGTPSESDRVWAMLRHRLAPSEIK